jgi:hypothetical protein
MTAAGIDETWNNPNFGRVTILTGHYGSGKTEVALNMALALKKCGIPKVALADLDIANVYFRSREHQQLLEDSGIAVHGNAYGYDIASDLPALSASLRAPLEDQSFRLVIDAGGNDSGARVLNQYRSLLQTDDVRADDVVMLIVVNANRPESDNIAKATSHLRAIEHETGLPVRGILNNTHMLRETTPGDILRGRALCQELSKNTGIPYFGDTCVRSLLAALKAEGTPCKDQAIYPLDLHMRPNWLDR